MDFLPFCLFEGRNTFLKGKKKYDYSMRFESIITFFLMNGLSNDVDSSEAFIVYKDSD